MGDEEYGTGNADCDALGHETVTTYSDEDGSVWECTRCGAEGWDDAEPAPASPEGGK